MQRLEARHEVESGTECSGNPLIIAGLGAVSANRASERRTRSESALYPIRGKNRPVRARYAAYASPCWRSMCRSSLWPSGPTARRVPRRRLPWGGGHDDHRAQDEQDRKRVDGMPDAPEQAVGDQGLVGLGGHRHPPVLAHARPALDRRAKRHDADERDRNAEHRVPREARRNSGRPSGGPCRDSASNGSAIHAAASGTHSVHITRSRRCSGMTPTTLRACRRTRTIIVPDAEPVRHDRGRHQSNPRCPLRIVRVHDAAALPMELPAIPDHPWRAGPTSAVESRPWPAHPPADACSPRPAPQEPARTFDAEEGRSMLRALFAQFRIKLMDLVQASARPDRRPLRDSQPHSRRRRRGLSRNKRAEWLDKFDKALCDLFERRVVEACAARDAGPTRRRRSPRCAC